jgi:DHA1 family multidrug resistance protein-like MFS transporter
MLLLLATSVWDIILLRMLGGFGFAFFWTTAEILVSDLSPPKLRVRQMGLYSVSWASGILLGPLIGGAIIQTTSFMMLFIASTSLIVVALILSITLLIPRYKKQTSVRKEFAGSIFTIRNMWVWYLIIMCFALIFSVMTSIFPGYANTVGISATLIGSLFMVYGIVRVFSFATSGRFLSFGEGKSLIVAATLATIATLSIGISRNLLVFFLAMVGLGVCYAIMFPLTIARVARNFPNAKLGAAVGSYEAIFGVGSAIGPFIAGSIAYLFGATLSFITTAAVGVLMTSLITFGIRKHDPTEQQ